MKQSASLLARALAARGFQVRVAHTAKQASRLVDDDPPQYAVVALKLPDASGLKLVSALLALDPHMRIVVLTGYPSIRTAVEAIKLGATDYPSARALSMDRCTLQRKLRKRPPGD